MCKEWYGTQVRQFSSYRDILACKDVDAVMIASPDHHHAMQLEATAKAGKHVYVEKPMARNMQELTAAVDAVKAAKIVVQVGTQTRSLPVMTGCHELWKSGLLGKASRIEQCRNSEKPYWYGYVKAHLPKSADVKQEDVDWKEFLGNAPERPFSADVLTGWYGYLDYTDGPVTNLGCHFIDLYSYITGRSSPPVASATAASSPGRTNTISPAPTTSRLCGSTPKASWPPTPATSATAAAAAPASSAKRASWCWTT